MSGIVIYRSSSGSTKQYVDWIGEETGFATYDSRDKAIPWGEVDTVVIGCPIIASKPFLSGWIGKNWERMKEKNVVLFTTSGADPAEAPVQEWIEKSLPEEIRAKIRFFPLAGRFDYTRLRGLNKAMIWIAGVLFGNKDVRNQIQNPVDGVAKEKLAELLGYLKGGG